MAVKNASYAPIMEKIVCETIEDEQSYSEKMNGAEMLTILDMLFAQAGLEASSSMEDVRDKLGDNGLEYIKRFYKALNEKEDKRSDAADSLSISEISDEEECTALVAKGGQYKKETEIAMSRIFSLGNVVAPVNAEVAPHDPYSGPNVVTMTGFGELGRFGNQVIQYMFLKAYGKLVNASIQVPYWVGKDLFGLDDTPVQRALPAVIETRETKANSTFTDDFLKYIVNSNGGQDVKEIQPTHLLDGEGDKPVNVDIWGWFQWHTKSYAPFKSLLQETFTPVPALKEHFDNLVEDKLRQNGKRTVVGCHLRLGDYKNIAASSFGYCAPTQWYLEWLEEIWPTLENPVLFVASDEVETVLRDFAKFNPITSEDLKADMPKEFAELNAGFFPDWYILSQCDHLAISNSTFSFSACMLNQRPNAKFYRAHYAKKIVEINPWCDEVIVHRDMNKSTLASGLETMQVVYNTQGMKGLLKNVLFELPFYGLRSILMKAVLTAKA